MCREVYVHLCTCTMYVLTKCRGWGVDPPPEADVENIRRVTEKEFSTANERSQV